MTTTNLLSLACALLAAAAGARASRPSHADAVVAQDGRGDFRTVQAALDAAPRDHARPWVIRIEPGTYREKLRIDEDRPFIHLVGASRDRTILTWGDYATMKGSDGKPIGTSATPSVSIRGHDFEANDLTFENTAAPRKVVGQAVAVAVNADRCVFRRCAFLGNQDTLYANGGRQLYDDCLIAGDVDFIFGNAAAVFRRCEIRSVGPGYVTAQSRTGPEQNTGYVFDHCRLTGPAPRASVYLGRPWRPYARVVYLDCRLGPHIRPVGWDNWRKVENESTAWYGEYESSGPGADAADRVPWSHQLARADVQPFEPERFLTGGDGWDPLKPVKASAAARR